MLSYLKSAYQRYFRDPQTNLLILLLAGGLLLVLFAGDILGPLLAALVFAYLLEGPVGWLQKRNVARGLAIALVYSAFLLLMIFAVLGLLPLLTNQLTQLWEQIPTMFNKARDFLNRLPEQYPTLVTEEQIRDLIQSLQGAIARAGQDIVSFSLASIAFMILVLIYLILVPFLVLFMLKDKERIVSWCADFLPRQRSLLRQIWHDMDVEIGNYVRGKFYEILIVGTAAFVAFHLMGLAYASLLAVLVGLSVIVPYVGAFAATVPVMGVSLFQWGWSADSAWMLAVYVLLQCLDGYMLVPLLFSQAVSLHPIVVIAALLFFGGLWGFWGVFFAIPLATLIKVVLDTWPVSSEVDDAAGETEDEGGGEASRASEA